MSQLFPLWGRNLKGNSDSVKSSSIETTKADPHMLQVVMNQTGVPFSPDAQEMLGSCQLSFQPRARKSRLSKKPSKTKGRSADPFPYEQDYQKILEFNEDCERRTFTYVARRRNFGDLVFLKTKRASAENAIESLRNEFTILQELEHPSIVRVVEFFRVTRGPILVLEYVRAQPLSKIVKCNGTFHEDEGSLIASNMCDAVGYLASQRIAHREISPDNVLLKRPIDAETRRLAAVLVGFNRARKDPAQEAVRSGLIAKFGVSRNGHASEMASDVWGIGTVTAAVLSGLPADQICEMDRSKGVDGGALTSGSALAKYLSELLPSTDAADFVACAVSPVERPVIAKLLEHPFLQKHLSCKNPQDLFGLL
jgi:serine/threonine protein kinase